MCWLIFPINDIVENIKFCHGFDRYGDLTKHVLVFPSTCLSPYAFPGMEYKKKHQLVLYFELYPGWGKDNPAFPYLIIALASLSLKAFMV